MMIEESLTTWDSSLRSLQGPGEKVPEEKERENPFRNVQNWQPTNQGQYNYCNFNANPSMQQNYGADARRVFNDQVYPIVDRANGRPPSTISNSNTNVLVRNDEGPDSWHIQFTIPDMK